MNYLAHFALSNYHEEKLVGNFLTDLMHKSFFGNFSLEIQVGYILHQHIDSFTDRHQLVLEAKSLLSKRSRRYAGILLDMYFDHLLIEHWNLFYEDEISTFISHVYDVLGKYEESFPSKAQIFSQRLKEHDLLNSYADIEGIKWALRRIDKRLKKPVGLDEMLNEIVENKEQISKLFIPFYSELQKEITEQFH